MIWTTILGLDIAIHLLGNAAVDKDAADVDLRTALLPDSAKMLNILGGDRIEVHKVWWDCNGTRKARRVFRFRALVKSDLLSELVVAPHLTGDHNLMSELVISTASFTNMVHFGPDFTQYVIQDFVPKSGGRGLADVSATLFFNKSYKWRYDKSVDYILRNLHVRRSNEESARAS